MGGSKPVNCAPPQWDNIPPELQALPHWVLWGWQKKPNGAWTKPPFQPDGSLASDTNPATWAPFDYVQTAFETAPGNGRHFDGVGFVLSERTPFTGFDFDNCLNAAGEITNPRVAEYVMQLSSYTEISPSLTGLRVIVIGKLPAGRRKRSNFECYDCKRYLTITGNLWPRGVNV
jgi:primase-polymerase (primpol)-like protein